MEFRIVILLLTACSWLLAARGWAQESRAAASTAIYMRSDTNATTVWSPRAELSGKVGEQVTLQAVYAADAWTSASIDIVTAATAPVHEVRHEVSGATTFALDELILSARYRYSTENDYWSHGGVLQAALDLAQHNTTLLLATFGSRDVVGHALDKAFREHQSTLGARLSWTQVIDPNMWAQLGWESQFVSGFQASPYRFVATGGQGTCRSNAPYCTPELVPDQRFRHALLAHARRALGKRFSAELDYRFYFDSWRVQSQTLSPSLSWLVLSHGILSVGYRYYTQREADFYQPRYLEDAQSTGYVTRDKELSAFYSHRLSLEYQHRFQLPTSKLTLTAAARASATRFRYLAFVGLSRVDALETTLVVGLDLL